jgi:hypothetical protein
MKKLSKFLETKFKNSLSKKSSKLYSIPYIKVNFHFKNKVISHYFESDSLRVFFNDFLNINYDILYKKISIFRKKIEDNIDLYKFESLNNRYATGSHIDIKYNSEKINLNKPDIISFNYYSYSFNMHLNSNVYHYKEDLVGHRFFSFSKNEMLVKMNKSIEKFIVTETKTLVEKFLDLSVDVNIHNFKDYLNLVNLKKY